MVLVTGGCGFIGSNFVKMWLQFSREELINLDILTYCGQRENNRHLERPGTYSFLPVDITDIESVALAINTYKPRAVIHFAAESHVDRSINSARPFIETNVLGTQNLLESSLAYWRQLSGVEKEAFRFLHISTDEVYGSLQEGDPAFTEDTRYAPSSPYAASKAASDHMASAYHKTHGLPILITNCSNNYGPYQYPEKLIPLTILRLQKRQNIPVYGDGMNIRDWLHVDDHCRALLTVLQRGRPGQTYNVGGNSERRNIEIVKLLCAYAAEMIDVSPSEYESLIEFVKDRPGHDFRYAIDFTKISKELDWRPQVSFEEGLRSTFEWYVSNANWVQSVSTKSYNTWIRKQYGATL